MAKQSRPKPNVCCPTPLPIREIIWGENNTPTSNNFELLDSGDRELLDSGDYELLDN